MIGQRPRAVWETAVQSRWGGQTVSGEFTLRGARDLDVRDLELSVAADLVRRFAPLAVDGTVSAQVGELALRDGLPARADGRLVWQDGVFLSPRGRVPLGSFAVEFRQGDGEPLRGRVLTLAGPLQADGEVELSQRHYL